MPFTFSKEEGAAETEKSGSSNSWVPNSRTSEIQKNLIYLQGLSTFAVPHFDGFGPMTSSSVPPLTMSS